jgi:hypothetical protein
VVYLYDLDGQTYTGIGHSGDIYANFDELRLDQKVEVFYDLGDEASSCLGDPAKHLDSLLRGTAFISTIPTLVIVGLKLRGSVIS